MGNDKYYDIAIIGNTIAAFSLASQRSNYEAFAN